MGCRANKRFFNIKLQAAYLFSYYCHRKGEFCLTQQNYIMLISCTVADPNSIARATYKHVTWKAKTTNNALPFNG